VKHDVEAAGLRQKSLADPEPQIDLRVAFEEFMEMRPKQIAADIARTPHPQCSGRITAMRGHFGTRFVQFLQNAQAA
jgi:hypothetical protein